MKLDFVKWVDDVAAGEIGEFGLTVFLLRLKLAAVRAVNP